MMTDPIADMLTRIRNANRIETPWVDMPATKVKKAIADVLQSEGFIHHSEIGKFVMHGNQKEFTPGAEMSEAKVTLRVYLKYGPDGERVIRHIARSSRPGRRYYMPYKALRRILDGLGISILSTSRGVMSDRQARRDQVGGEVLAIVW